MPNSRRDYRRDCTSRWLGEALQRAGRLDELLAMYEAEARATGSYERLVKYLIDTGRLDDAERRAREGIQKTAAKFPGVATSLRDSLCELARRRKKWGVVAAHAAFSFFEQPSPTGFHELVGAAGKAKCGERVRTAALAFLESGKPPLRWSAGPKGKRGIAADPEWPLPTPDYLVPLAGENARRLDPPRPHHGVLLEMAIADKRPDDVLRWYAELEASKPSAAYARGRWDPYGYASYSDRVADAVASTHPERALEIYRSRLDESLTHADINAYEACAAYLRKLRPILKTLGREAEWTHLLGDIRTNYRNRRRFMEILDGLEGQTILQTHKLSRRR